MFFSWVVAVSGAGAMPCHAVVVVVLTTVVALFLNRCRGSVVTFSDVISVATTVFLSDGTVHERFASFCRTIKIQIINPVLALLSSFCWCLINKC